MSDKKQVQLPLPDSTAKPNFLDEGHSNDEYVTVLTPDHKALAPDTPDTPDTADAVFDSNGLRMNAWTVELRDADLRTAYYWWVCCCPCFSLAQLETRLGLNSYGIGLALGMAAYTGRTLLLLLTLGYLFAGCFVPFAICLSLFVFCLLGVAHRVSHARMQTRELLDISGSTKDDRIMGCVRGASVIRQMAVQLKCDQVHFGAPATLQAYQV